MIRYTKFFITFLLAVIALGARSQSTTSSPYSRYGLGDINAGVLPQNAAMGGISTATNLIGGFSSINPLNPASYGSIYITTIDVGLFANRLSLSQTGQTGGSNGNFGLSHITFAVPVTKHSALSFGLLPYSQLGYNYKQTLNRGFGTASPADTNMVNYVYSGEGGLSKAYLGYGIKLFKHLSIGANVSYIFGQLKHTQTTEFPQLASALNTSIEDNNSISGLNYDYGVQYIMDFSLKRHLVLGYSASASSQLNSQSSYIVSQYTFDQNGVANLPIDSLINQQSAKTKIQLPQINHFGISYQNDDKFLIGADYTIGKWSNLTIGGTNQGLVDSKTLRVGGQYIPNIDAVGNYWSTIEYRLGLVLDQTYLNVNNPTGGGLTNIKSQAVTFGLGLRLRPYYQNIFYKINVSGEVGQRGTLSNGLVKENYFTLRLGFMINDRWFQKIKFD
ncbi:MAG: hypothetical protein ABI367_09795 [Mucilaginibacter sp.]